MIFDNLESIKNKFFFAIVIGSGPAGISAALKLEHPIYFIFPWFCKEDKHSKVRFISKLLSGQ